jgi:hypothetical protein
MPASSINPNPLQGNNNTNLTTSFKKPLTLGASLKVLMRLEEAKTVNHFLDIVRMCLQEPAFLDSLRYNALRGNYELMIYHSDLGFVNIPYNPTLSKMADEFHHKHQGQVFLKQTHSLPEHELTVSPSFDHVYLSWY